MSGQLRQTADAGSPATATPKRSARSWKIADSFFLLLCIFSAVVQFNDPDPLVWMTPYGLAAIACVLAMRERLRWWFAAAVGVACLVWAGTIAPRVLGQVPFLDMFGAWEMQSAGIEESREMYGLLIAAFWMAVLTVRVRRR